MASPAPTRRHQSAPKPSPVRRAVEKRIFADISELPEPTLKEIEEYIRRKKRALQSFKRKRTAAVTFNRHTAVIEKPRELTAIPRRTLEGSGMGAVLSVEDASERIEAFTVDDASTDWADTELLGSGELADRLGVARGSVYNWRTAGKVVAFQKGVRNYVYPYRQFNERAPIRGIEQVLPHFSTPEDAWEWLVTPNQTTHGESPIELLRADKIEEVARAAEGALDFA